jgi:uncharacterized membrane-anchored protein
MTADRDTSVTSAVLVVALFFQFRLRRYVPSAYPQTSRRRSSTAAIAIDAAA